MVNRPKSAVVKHLSVEVNRHFYVSPRSSEGLVWTARGSSGVLMADSGSFPEVCARFGRFQLDLSSRELFCLGNRVAIQDKPLQILRLLLEANGQVVSREQIRSALWPQDTFVDFEHGVNTAVKKLRQALEDSAERPEFVETLPRVGYRFMVPVEWITAEISEARAESHGISIVPPHVGSHEAAPMDPQSARAESRWWLYVFALAVIAVA